MTSKEFPCICGQIAETPSKLRTHRYKCDSWKNRDTEQQTRQAMLERNGMDPLEFSKILEVLQKRCANKQWKRPKMVTK